MKGKRGAKIVHCVAKCMESQLRLELVVGSSGFGERAYRCRFAEGVVRKGACKYKSCIQQELLRRAAKELIPSTGILES